MIGEQYVGYDTAELLKKAGFLEQTDTCYFGTTKRIGRFTTITEDNGVLPRPTQAVAVRWLREKKGLHVYAIQTNLPLTEPQTTEWEWGYVVTKVDDPNGRDNFIDMYYTSYEEAMEAGIRHALELVIDKMDGEGATGEGICGGTTDL